MATATELIANRESYVTDKDNSLSGFINLLLNAASVFYEDVVGDEQVFHSPLNRVEAMLNAIQTEFPEIPSTVIPDFAVPAVPDISFTDITHDITTLEAARAELLSDLNAGGYGIDTADETQLIDRTRDRQTAEAARAVDEVDRSFQNRRFSTPPGALYAAHEQVREAQRAAVSSVNREIYVQRADQFVRARQFAISTAGVADRTRADILEIQFRVEEQRARFLLALFQSQLDQFRTQVQFAIDKVTLAVRVYEAQSVVADSRVRSAAEAARVFVAEYQANTQAFLGVVNTRLANARNQLDAAKARSDAEIQTATAGVSYYSSVVQAALGAINTMVTQSSENT